MSSPEQVERDLTLTTAVQRFEELRLRDSLTDPEDPDGPDDPCGRRDGARPLDQAEALELLLLGEVIARKAGYGRQLAVRTARAAGASWAQVGQALGTSRQSAWEAHTRWIQVQARQHDATGYEGFDEAETARALAAAGTPDDERAPTDACDG